MKYKTLCVNHNEHPYAIAEIVRLQGFMPTYLVEERSQIVQHLRDDANINILLFNGDQRAVAYAFASLQTASLVNSFRIDDPLMPIVPDQYYIDQVVMEPYERKGMERFGRIVTDVFKVANRREIVKFSVYALCDGGINRAIGRIFRKYIHTKRPVVLQSYGGKRYEYMEAICDDFVGVDMTL